MIWGPPCQGFSVIGRIDQSDPAARGTSTTSSTSLRHIRPRAFVMENVKALGASRRWAHIRMRGLIDRAAAP